MQIVFLVNLLLNGAINAQAHDKGIILAGRSAIFMVSMLQRLLKLVDLASRIILLFVNGVLKVATQALDLLNLLA